MARYPRKRNWTGTNVRWAPSSLGQSRSIAARSALALLHHLAADRSEATRALLEDVLVLVDPLQNPDGRARFLADRIRWQGRVLSTDRQALAHQGGWPSARGNHYFLDLNRDWFALSQPESRARVRVLLDGFGSPVYDPYPTVFPTGGFDLEAVGVLHVAPEPAATLQWVAGLLALAGLSARPPLGARRRHAPSATSPGV